MSPKDREELRALVREEIDAALGGMPGYQRLQYDRKLAAKRRDLIADRAALVAASPTERVTAIKAMTPGRRSELFGDMSLGDQVSVARDLPRDALDLLLEVTAERDQIEVAVSPPVPFVAVTAQGSVRTSPVPASRYPGFSWTQHPGTRFVEPLESWMLRLSIDADLRALIGDKVTVEKLPADECRSATLKLWRDNPGKRVPALPTAARI